MKRLILLLIFSLIITGCGQKRRDENSIVLWHWMIDRDNAFQELAKKYTVQTGIKVKIELFAPSDSYSKRIIASAQAGVLPDIYGV
jgi:ABC-type glycerol-3-phosphate transport system substrate-binding protein